jgi:hypothetical protein
MKQHRVLQAVLLAVSLLGAASAKAQCPDVCINLSGDGAAQLASQLNYASTEQMSAAIRSQVMNLFQVADVGSFLRDFQNAQSFASKGLGVDYASETTLLEVGATLSVASNVDKAYKPSGSYTDPPISGGGANFSLMGGLGFGLFGLDPVMVFANWFKGSASLGQLDGNYNNWGVHGQLRLLGPSRSSSAAKFLIRWGGIAITSGADYSRVTLNARKNIHSTFTLPAAEANLPYATVSIQNQGTLAFSLQQTTWTVPLEVTTSLRLLSLVTIYGGFGLDFQLGGGSDLLINMESGNLSGQIGGGQKVDLGSAQIVVSQHANPSAARFREIVGLQLGIFDIVRLFLQVNNTPSSPSMTSLAVGARVGI